MTDIDTLAIAVRDQLNVAAQKSVFDPAFTVEIDDKPEFDIKAIEALSVTLLPYGTTMKPVTRSQDVTEHTLQLSFRQHAESPAAAGPDSIEALSAKLRALIQSVMVWLSIRSNRRPIAGQNWPRLTGIQPKPLYDAQALREQRTYIGVIELIYEEMAVPA